MAVAESPGERTRDFSLLNQANNNFLEKETSKLFNTATNLNFIKVKKL